MSAFAYMKCIECLFYFNMVIYSISCIVQQRSYQCLARQLENSLNNLTSNFVGFPHWIELIPNSSGDSLILLLLV